MTTNTAQEITKRNADHARAWQAMTPADREAKKAADVKARNLSGSNGHHGTTCAR